MSSTPNNDQAPAPSATPGALAMVPTSAPMVPAGVPQSIDEAFRIGNVMAKSGFFQDSKEVAQACAKVLAGRELGIGPLAAMTGLYIIKGRVTLSANLIGAQIRRSGRYDYRVRKLDASECHLDFYDNGQLIGESRLTMAEAKARELDVEWKDGSQRQKEPWKKFPENMLFARALSNGAKWFCPDVFSGPVYTPEEMGARVDESGEVIDITPVEPAPTTQSSTRNTHLKKLPTKVDPETGEIVYVPTSYEPVDGGTGKIINREPSDQLRETGEMTPAEAFIDWVDRKAQKLGLAPEIADQLIAAALGVQPGESVNLDAYDTETQLRPAMERLRKLKNLDDVQAFITGVVPSTEDKPDAETKKLRGDVAAQLTRLKLSMELEGALDELVLPEHTRGTPLNADQCRRLLIQLRKFKDADAVATWVDLKQSERRLAALQAEAEEQPGGIKRVDVFKEDEMQITAPERTGAARPGAGPDDKLFAEDNDEAPF